MPITRKGSKGSRAGSAIKSTTNSLRVVSSVPSMRGTSKSESQSGGGTGFEQLPSFLSQYSQLDEGHSHDESDMCIYFVLPEGTTTATCVPSLASNYLLCVEHPLRCKWLSEEECLKTEPQPGNIFVLASFEGPLFTYLENHRKTSVPFEIVGPQCIGYAIKSREIIETINYGHAPFTMGMRNILVTLTGIPDAQKKQLSKRIHQMNGSVSTVFSQAVTHVVAGDILSVKCAVAYENKIPVMTIQWVEAVWESSQVDLLHATDPKYVKYTCPVFHNLNICVSQVSLDLKSALKNAIEANGGKYSAELVRNKTDILIIPKGGGDKYRYAQQWKLACVTPDWVDASKSAGHVLPLKDFEAPEEMVKASTPKHSMVVPLNVSNISILSQIPNSKANHNNVENLTMVQCTNDGVLQLKAEDIKVLKQAVVHGPYLDGCKIYISGSQRSEQLRKLLKSSAAVCHHRLNENVTHFLVTEKKISDAESEILRHLDPRPHIVTFEWLVETAKTGIVADEDIYTYPFDCGSTGGVVHVNETVRSTVNHSLGDARVPNIELIVPVPEQEPNVVLPNGPSPLNSTRNSGNKTSSTGKNISNPANGTHDASISCNSIESESQPVLPFNGMRIKINVDDEDENEELQQHIEDGGGEIVDDDFEILILPPVYTVTSPIKKSIQCFTKQWVFDCNSNNDSSGHQISPTYCHKALPAFEEMKIIMNGVVIAVSQYSNPEKEYLAYLVTSMGGLYQDVFARKTASNNITKRTTHLICAVTDNDKYRAAKKWGTPIVVAEWIVDSFLKKKKLGEHAYNPAFRIDSESTVNFMPLTPKNTQPNSKPKQHRNGTGSIISNFLPSAEKKQILIFPASTGTGQHCKAPIVGTEATNDDSFQAWIAAGEHLKYVGKPLSDPSASFIEWQKNQKANASTTSGDDSVIIEGKSKAEVRELREAVRMMGANSPVPGAADIIRNPRHSTPISVMMARTWEKILEKFPVGENPLAMFASTPKTEELKIRNIDSLNSTRSRGSTTGTGNQSETDDLRTSCKRSSDSSLEDDAVARVKITKKMRFSSSDDSDHSNHSEPYEANHTKSVYHGESSTHSSTDPEPACNGIFNNAVLWISKNCPNYDSIVATAQKLGGRLVSDPINSEVTHFVIKKVTQEVTKASSGRPSIKIVNFTWVEACELEGTLVNESMHKPTPAVASSKSSMKALNNLLAADPDECNGNENNAKKSQNVGNCKKKNSANLVANQNQGEINPDELDAPHVIWVANEDDIELENPPKSEGVEMKTSKNLRSTRSGSKNDAVPERIQTRGSKSKSIEQSKRSSRSAEGIKNKGQLPVEVPRNSMFLMSGVNDEDKVTATEVITSCGGRISATSGYDPECFAIIVGALARSEKVLGCVGAGKCLLENTYIMDCRKAKRLIPIKEEHIWKDKDGMTKTEMDIAAAGYMWFIRGLKNSKDKPMANIKFYLMEGNTQKRSAYSRLIQASGGEVIATPEDATYILSDGRTSVEKFDPTIVKQALFLNELILFNNKRSNTDS